MNPPQQARRRFLKLASLTSLGLSKYNRNIESLTRKELYGIIKGISRSEVKTTKGKKIRELLLIIQTRAGIYNIRVHSRNEDYLLEKDYLRSVFTRNSFIRCYFENYHGKCGWAYADEFEKIFNSGYIPIPRDTRKKQKT